MSKTRDSVSFSEVQSPLTGIGLWLDEPLELTAPQFRIHECGYTPEKLDDWNSGPVSSLFWCLWYAQDEGTWVESNGKRWDLSPDRILFAPAQVVNSTHSIRPVRHLWLHFSLLPAYAYDAAEPFTIPLNALLRAQLDVFIEAYCNAGHDWVNVLYSYSSALLYNCFARHPLPLRPLPDSIRAVLEEIDKSPGNVLSNTRMARLANLSLSSFAEHFKTYMHRSPASYVRYVRCERASQLLVYSDLSIEQIAAELGFPNRYYFTRSFTRHTGHAPAAFRKARRPRAE
jgi:AraC family transcriptional regulator of arabinose operon